MSETRPQWASQRAMAWVIDEAPVPTALFPVLMVIARRCDERGRGSYQSAPTIAEKTGKSEDQVKRDIRELKKLGLLTPGDPGLVEHIDPWKRPAVYDVPLHVSGLKPLKESKNKAGVKSQGGCMDAPPGMDAPGGMDGRGRGGMDAPGGGGMDAPQTKPLKKTMNNPSSPNPSAPGTDLVVLDAEIVEEAEESEASPENQLQKLIDDVRKIRPSWSVTELRTYITGALALLDENFEAVTILALNTAKDPDSAKPSRLTASRNPHLQQVHTALMVQRADAMPDPGPTNLHPDAHPFEPSDSGGPGCNRCEMPKANGRHRVGNQGGGYVGRTTASRANQHQPYRNPTDMSAYEDWSVLGGPSPGASIRPGGTRLRLTDSRHPDRNYDEPI